MNGQSNMPIDLMFRGTGVDKMSEEEQFRQMLKRTDYIRYKEYMLLAEMQDSLKALASYRTLSKGIVTRTVGISTTPTKLIQASQDRSYTIINPTQAIGLTTPSTLYPAGTTVVADGNSQATPIFVSNYDSVHFFINVTGIVGAPAPDVTAQTYDELSGTWTDVQVISPPGGIVATGTYYSFFSGMGVVTRIALKWAATGAWGSITWSMGYTLKIGLGGNSSGTAQTVFLGNNYVTRYTGYPLLEGQYRDWYMRENAELFGVCQSGTVNVNIIEYI